MAKYTRVAVINTIHEQGMMPLFYHRDVSVGKSILTACYEGGGRLMEFTNRGDFAHEVFSELAMFARNELPGLILGIGSVPDAGTASLYLQLGANFVVSPVMNPEVGKVCNRRKVLWIPGCGTASEIANAEEAGAEIVKVFPGNTLGPQFVSAVLGPSPWTSIIPTGGVVPTRENLGAWFDAGVVAVGMGSKLISSEIIKAGDFPMLKTKIESTLQLIKTLRHISA